MGNTHAVVQGLPTLNYVFFSWGEAMDCSWQLGHFQLAQSTHAADGITVWNWELSFPWAEVYNSLIGMGTFAQRRHKKGVKTLYVANSTLLLFMV